jgi:hypothetical protein
MTIKDLHAANDIYSNIMLLRSKKENLLTMRANVNSYKDVKSVSLAYRSYQQAEEKVEFITIKPGMMTYNLYVRDNLSPGMVKFIDEQVTILDNLIKELLIKLETL